MKLVSHTSTSTPHGNPTRGDLDLLVPKHIAQIAAPNGNGKDKCSESLDALTLAVAKFGMQVVTARETPRTALASLAEVEKALKQAKDDCGGNPPALELINREVIRAQQHRNMLEFIAKRKDTMNIALEPEKRALLKQFAGDILNNLDSLKNKPGNTQPNWELPNFEPVIDFLKLIPGAAWNLVPKGV
jgi:hypothetical protein